MTEKLRALLVHTQAQVKFRTDKWWSEPWAPGKWQRREVLGHLIDSAANNHLRFVGALTRPTFEGTGYDQDACVRVQDFASVPTTVLTDLFLNYNRHLAHVLDRIPPEKLATPCRIGDQPVMTLEELAVDYIEHLEHHLKQILS